MNLGKYIVIGDKDYPGGQMAIMFDKLISHDRFCDSFSNKRIVSAGFFMVEAEASKNDDRDISISCFGKSVSLKKESREEDVKLLKRVLRDTTI